MACAHLTPIRKHKPRKFTEIYAQCGRTQRSRVTSWVTVGTSGKEQTKRFPSHMFGKPLDCTACPVPAQFSRQSKNCIHFFLSFFLSFSVPSFFPFSFSLSHYSLDQRILHVTIPQSPTIHNCQDDTNSYSADIHFFNPFYKFISIHPLHSTRPLIPITSFSFLLDSPTQNVLFHCIH